MVSKYFKTCIKPWTNAGDIAQIFHVLLTEKEKEESGCYDVLVLSWVKVFTPKQKTKNK